MKNVQNRLRKDYEALVAAHERREQIVKNLKELGDKLQVVAWVPLTGSSCCSTHHIKGSIYKNSRLFKSTRYFRIDSIPSTISTCTGSHDMIIHIKSHDLHFNQKRYEAAKGSFDDNHELTSELYSLADSLAALEVQIPYDMRVLRRRVTAELTAAIAGLEGKEKRQLQEQLRLLKKSLKEFFFDAAACLKSVTCCVPDPRVKILMKLVTQLMESASLAATEEKKVSYSVFWGSLQAFMEEDPTGIEIEFPPQSQTFVEKNLPPHESAVGRANEETI
jgi:hypothetical protein